VFGVTPGFDTIALQGYLAHKIAPTPLGQPYDRRHCPILGSEVGVASYGQGNPVAFKALSVAREAGRA